MLEKNPETIPPEPGGTLQSCSCGGRSDVLEVLAAGAAAAVEPNGEVWLQANR